MPLAQAYRISFIVTCFLLCSDFTVAFTGRHAFGIPAASLSSAMVRHHPTDGTSFRLFAKRMNRRSPAGAARNFSKHTDSNGGGNTATSVERKSAVMDTDASSSFNVSRSASSSSDGETKSGNAQEKGKKTTTLDGTARSFTINEGDESKTKTDMAASKTGKHNSEEYDLPWGDLQKWALRDHLAKFTVQVPMTIQGKDTIQVYTRWRSLVNEVTELSGYPIPFLLERYSELKKKNEITVHTSGTVLPYLDRYEFETNGGLSGVVSGVLGVADGTRIQTTPVGDVHETIPKGFVRTEDGQVIYELGQSATDELSTQVNALDDRLKYKLVGAAERARNSVVPNDVKGLTAMVPDMGNPDLVNVAALSAVVLGGAFAMQVLSHHVTVNVFWV